MHSELRPDEEYLEGGWIEAGDAVIPDPVAARIDWLVRERLEPVARDAAGWDALYRDSRDGRLWERIHAHSDRHGGGPASLRHIPTAKAMRKYEIQLEIVRRKIRELFPDRDPEEVLIRLQAPEVPGGQPRHRVSLAVLKLYEEGDGDLSSLMESATEDSRDVLAWAEYPNQTRFGPTDDPEKARQLEEMDRLQYEAWLNK